MVNLKKIWNRIEDFLHSPRQLESMAEARISFFYKPKKDEDKLAEMISRLAKSEKESILFFSNMCEVAMRLRLFYLEKKKVSKSYEVSRLMANSLCDALERVNSGNLALSDTDKHRLEAFVKYWEDISSIGSSIKSTLIEDEIKEITEFYIREGRLDEGISDLKAILEEKRKTGNKTEIVVTLRAMADFMRKKRDLEGALKYYQEAVNIDPRAWFDVGFILGEMQKYVESLEAYENFLEEVPKNVYALNNAGWTLENLQEFSKSLKYYEKALTYDPTLVSSWLGKGRILLEQGSFDQAIKANEKVLEIDPDNQRALTNLTAIYNDVLKDYEKAVYYAEKSFDKNPKDLISRSNLVESLITARRYKEARSHANNVLKLDYDPSRRLAMYFMISLSYFLEGKIKEGTKCLDTFMDYRTSLPENFKNNWVYKGISNFLAESDIQEDYKTKLFGAINSIEHACMPA
ncbi:MAG: tetratricopeptide repeat protein [Candidatus Hodarchaeota archaeon]